ncbi:HvfC/BufC N-terminal domain-containing protein [Sorangium sp. So ce1151]|uniref:HvfC/BufC N-terminal domain-containing protein n=1 Tax=Sorangium sp. So ce1151 TaxID=3133332 RepID=UPI003F5EC66A
MSPGGGGPPRWLRELQRDFTAVLRAPLDSGTGVFRERQERYPARLVAELRSGPGGPAPAERLALYHRQYWMRLFTALQTSFPRVSRAMGYWHFNHLAALHLAARPPRHFDLDEVARGFAARLDRALQRLDEARRGRERPAREHEEDAWSRRVELSRAPLDMVRQALHMDEAERHAFESPFEGLWRPTPEELAGLAQPEARLRFAVSFTLAQEDWDLARFSRLAGAEQDGGAPEAIRRHPSTRTWVFARSAAGTTTTSVDPLFARLLERCRELPFGEALAAVEQGCTAEEAARLRAGLQGWIALALASGWWTGLAEAEPRAQEDSSDGPGGA